MIKIKLFLASSEELKVERLAIAELVTKLNCLWAGLDVLIQLVKWEYLDSSMGPQHKQEDYNDKLKQCDLCIVLYWTRFGMYTAIELEAAYNLCNSESCMKQMAVFFKEGGDMTPELSLFRIRYEAEHPELCQSFVNEADLKEIFCQQVISCIKVKNEEKHKLLEKNVKKAQKLLMITGEDEPDYKEYQQDLYNATKALERNESFMDKIGQNIKCF